MENPRVLDASVGWEIEKKLKLLEHFRECGVSWSLGRSDKELKCM
jgi:hypothetical protein